MCFVLEDFSISLFYIRHSCANLIFVMPSVFLELRDFLNYGEYLMTKPDKYDVIRLVLNEACY